VTALRALAVARRAGVKLNLDGDDLIAEAPDVPADVFAILRPAKAEILCILKWRDLPRAWGRPNECGVGLLVGENQVTAEAITVESVRHTWLRFYGAKVVETTGLAVVIEAAEGGGKRFGRG
jgi:hypothetical protein